MINRRHPGDRVRRTVAGVDRAPASAMEPRLPGRWPRRGGPRLWLASRPFAATERTGWAARADFLDDVAVRIDALGENLVRRRCGRAATGGQAHRRAGRHHRQLRLSPGCSAKAAGRARGSTTPTRAPPRRPDIRQRQDPAGPVVVFGASNSHSPSRWPETPPPRWPPAAQWCQGTRAHPGTSELVVVAVAGAVRAAGCPRGVLPALRPGRWWVPAWSATLGSRLSGLRLPSAGAGHRRGAFRRPRRSPSMPRCSSVNPVFLLPGALASRGAELGTAYAGSLTSAAGQFCTNPGLVFAAHGP